MEKCGSGSLWGLLLPALCYNPPMRPLLILLAVFLLAECSSSSTTETTETAAVQDQDQRQAETSQIGKPPQKTGGAVS